MKDYRSWAEYAVHADGRTLLCAVSYNHSVRGDWEWREKSPAGSIRDVPAPRGRLGRGWTYTDEGLTIIEERKRGTL